MSGVLSEKDIEHILAYIDGDEPILTRYQQTIDNLKANHLVQTLVLKPCQILVHPDNRSTLKLNSFNMHRLGAKIKSVGASHEELAGAVCIEMATNAEARSKQLLSNKKLAEISNGYICEVLGSEKYLSVGGSHMAGFCRAAIHGCKTSEHSIRDDGGRVDLHKIKADPVFADILDKGWEWLVVSASVEETFPRIADFMQRALNSTNSIASDASELEVMSSIAQFAANQEKAGEPINWDACSSAACASNPPCADYGYILARFAQDYGGGRGAPLVTHLDNFAKKHSEHLILGQDYITAVCDVKFGATKPCPYVRAALMATNMTSTKSVDRIARLLTKVDIAKLESKDKLPQVHKLEESLKGLEALQLSLDSMNVIPLEDSMDHLFLCMIRAVTHLVGKTKQTFLNQTYESMDAIMELFHEEVNSCVPEESRANAKAEPEAAASAAVRSSELVSFSDVASHEHIAKQKGLAIGGVVFERSVGSSTLYYIKKVAEQVEIEALTLLHGTTPNKAAIELEKSLKDFNVFKGDTPELLKDELVSKHSIDASSTVLVDEYRTQMFSALRSYHSKHAASTTDDFYYAIHPVALHVGKAFKAGKLTIVPLVPLSSIALTTTVGQSSIDTSSIVKIGKVKMSIVINKPMLATSQSPSACGRSQKTNK